MTPRCHAPPADLARRAVDDRPATPPTGSATFDRRLAADLAADLHRLKAVSPPGADHRSPTCRPDLRERYVGANGEFLVRAFAKDSLWDYAGPAAVHRRGRDRRPGGDRQGVPHARRAAADEGRVRVGRRCTPSPRSCSCCCSTSAACGTCCSVLFPLAVGVVLTLGVMGLCGVPLNPANMIALPLIVGVGVDNGVHVLHDYRGRAAGRAVPPRRRRPAAACWSRR